MTISLVHLSADHSRQRTQQVLLHSTATPDLGVRPYLENKPLHDTKVVEDGHHTAEENNDGQGLQARHRVKAELSHTSQHPWASGWAWCGTAQPAHTAGCHNTQLGWQEGQGPVQILHGTEEVHRCMDSLGRSISEMVELYCSRSGCI